MLLLFTSHCRQTSLFYQLCIMCITSATPPAALLSQVTPYENVPQTPCSKNSPVTTTYCLY